MPLQKFLQFFKLIPVLRFIVVNVELPINIFDLLLEVLGDVRCGIDGGSFVGLLAKRRFFNSEIVYLAFHFRFFIEFVILNQRGVVYEEF